MMAAAVLGESGTTAPFSRSSMFTLVPPTPRTEYWVTLLYIHTPGHINYIEGHNPDIPSEDVMKT